MNRLVEKAIAKYQERFELSKKLKNYTDQEDGEVLYLFPKYDRLVESGLAESNKVIIDSFLAHELLHREQERRNMNSRFPNLKEGPAWVLQFLYGADQMGFNDYYCMLADLVRKIDSGVLPSEREKEYTGNVEYEIQVVTQTLEINLSGNSDEQLGRFKDIFNEPRYGEMSGEMMYLFLRERLLADLVTD